jgi:hypothetical protein
VFLLHTIGNYLNLIIRKTVSFFRSATRKEVMTFLIFVFVAFVFWVLQSMQEVTEYELAIPVVYEQIPGHVTITNKLPVVFTITLRDKGVSLYQYFRHRKGLAIHINPMNWYKEDGISYVDMGIIESRIRSRLKATTQLLSVKPDTMALFFVEKARKTLPVSLIKDITLAPQHFMLGEPFLYPDSITAYAPQSVLDKLDTIRTKLLKVDDLKKAAAFTVGLQPIDGVQFSSDKIEVRLNVEEFTEYKLSIPVQGINFPPDETLLAFPPEINISFLVGLSMYNKINPDDFKLVIDYEKLLHANSNMQAPVLALKPSNIQHIRLEPETIECLIEKK